MGSERQAVSTSAKVAASSGSSATLRTSGPASTSSALCVAATSSLAKPMSTPTGSLSRSQRDTCVTSGAASDGGAPSRTASTRRSTRPGVPSSRKKHGASLAAAPAQMPVRTRIEAIAPSESGWFLAENGSMLGGMICTRAASSSGGT